MFDKPKGEGYTFTAQIAPPDFVDKSLSEGFDSVIVTFSYSGRAIWKWIPKNAEVLQIVQLLLSFPVNRSRIELRRQLKDLIGRYG